MNEKQTWFITGAGRGPGSDHSRRPGAAASVRCRCDAVETVEQKADELLAQVDAYRELSSSLAFEPEVAAPVNRPS
jgi:hypothetical protein